MKDLVLFFSLSLMVLVATALKSEVNMNDTKPVGEQKYLSLNP